MAHGKAPMVIVISLLVFVGLGLMLIFFGARMAMYRVDQRALAEPATAIVRDVDSRTTTSRDTDGRTTTSTEYTYLVEFNLSGDQLRRPLVAANFDAEDVWFTRDEVDPEVHSIGAEVPVLVRADLDYAASPAGFWAAYLVPVFLLGFGTFITLFLGFWSYMFFRR